MANLYFGDEEKFLQLLKDNHYIGPVDVEFVVKQYAQDLAMKAKARRIVAQSDAEELQLHLGNCKAGCEDE